MRTPTLALIVLAAACSSSHAPRLPRAPHGEVVIELRGDVKGGPYVLGRDDLAALPRRSVRGVDPASGREAVWEGTAIAALLTNERLQLKKGADTVVVRTEDQMAIPIPLTVLRQAKPVLVDHADGVPVGNGRMLAWPSMEQRGLETDPRARLWWAKDILSLEVVNGYATYGTSLTVPPGAAQGARIGADLFGDRCMSCHQLRKAGGHKGPDLTRVADRIAAERFSAHLRNHPGWAERGLEAPGEEAIDQIWGFLRAVAAESASGPFEEPTPLPTEREARDEPPVRGPVR
jgi:mono/diheme cytochrome c family protein